MKRLKQANKRKNKKDMTVSRKNIFIKVVVLIPVLIILIYLILGLSNTSYKIEYVISPSLESKNILDVTLTIYGLNKKNREYLPLYKGDINLLQPICTDDSGRKVVYAQNGEVLAIPVSGLEGIAFKYKVEIGQTGKHGFRGSQFDDLLTFDGSQVLVFPTIAVNGSDEEIIKSIKEVKILYDIPVEWSRVVPFEKKDDKTGNVVTRVVNPKWNDFYNIALSCYAFGRFEEKEYLQSNGRLRVYMDGKSDFQYSAETLEGINSLYEYYSKVFGYTIPRLDIVLLREDNKDRQYIMGGSGFQIIGSTFNPELARDWQLLGHRMFHAFFDYKVDSTKFHMAPQLWFYEGLTTYYENTAMDQLPKEILSKIQINSQDSLLSLFRRYTYMYLKDPNLFRITPMKEANISSSAQLEFLHYTQAPLIVKAMEDISYSNNKEHDRILRYIINNHRKGGLELKNIFEYAIGSDSLIGFAKNYLFGDNILPLWYLSNNIEENSEEVISQLNEFEYLLWTWFRSENIDFKNEILTSDKLEALSIKAEYENIYFAQKEIEEKVKGASKTVYDLLKQYALRAKVCGVEYDEKLRDRLLSNTDNIRKWEEYKLRLE